jgi:site-specific DNA recombinase
LLRDYAEKQTLSVVREFEEVESAKAAGRTEFEKMLEFLRKNENVEHILVEKTDRLTRNFADVVKVGELKRSVHYVKEGQIMSKDARAADIMISDIKVAVAKMYIGQLSEETKKGMLEKAQQGLYPSWAPLGYVNNPETKGIDIDFMRAGIIRELFETYSSGTVSLLELTRIAREKGLRSRKGMPVVSFLVDRMLSNPVYIGDFKWKGVYYKGKHEAIVERTLFEVVQRIRESRRWARRCKREFAFRGFVKCGHCGGMMTPFEKKGKYVYYRCTKTRGKCPESAIREERLVELLGESLKRLRMTKDRAEWLKQALVGETGKEKEYRAQEKKKLQAEYKEIERKIGALYEDKQAGVVDTEFWKKKYEEYRATQKMLEERLAENADGFVECLEDANMLLELCQSMYSLYLEADNAEKRKLLNMLLWNPRVQDGKVEYELRKGFALLVDGVEEEEKLIAQNAPMEERNKIWLLR